MYAQNNWQLVVEKEEVKVYTSTVSTSKIKAIKVQSLLEAKASQVVALLMDVESAPDWIYHTKSCKLIRRVSPAEIYYYSEVSLPWPAENRDFVAHLTVTQHPHTQVVTIDGPSVKGMVPVAKGVVRVNDSKGRWILTPQPGNYLQVEYSLHVDPGGNIPAWLINMFATQGPLDIFRQMKVELKKQKYRNAQLAYIKN
ncbi:START domain-containing protein [Arcticibacter sp.]|uniref:START domain-containing protein n=1 Tax=Arcticibacter sp. TaxID=1872630 RepID=UPI00388E37ED